MSAGICVVFGQAAGIVANSAWTAETAWALCETLGVEGSKRVTAIDLGTDPRQFRPDNNHGRLRAKLGWQEACIALTVARLVPHKGQDVALRACAAVVREHPALRYLIVGEGTTSPRCGAWLRTSNRRSRRVRRSLDDNEVAERMHSDVYLGPLARWRRH